jgi:hypothetical protein
MNDDKTTRLYPILQLYLPACVDANMFQRFSGEIIVLSARLQDSQDCGFVYTAGRISINRAG